MKTGKKIILLIIIIFIQYLIINTYGIIVYEVQADAELYEENNLANDIEIIKLREGIASATTIPTQYDLRKSNPYGFSNHGNINITVENQVGGTCWDFASMMSLQTFLAQSTNSSSYPLLSKAHLDYLNSKYSGKLYAGNRDIGTGAGFGSALNYFKNNDGPVLNTKCYYTPYNGGYTNERVTINGKSYNNTTDALKTSSAKIMDSMTPDYYVHETIALPKVNIKGPSTTSLIGTANMYYTNNGKTVSATEMKEIRNTVKQHIMKNGGIYCSIRTNDAFIGNNLGSPYNTYDGKYSQYDDGSISNDNTGSHAITIIGWNDNYSRTKFNAKNSSGQIVHPTTNGAWLAVNNYGSSSFENGCQWISYEDYNVNANLNGYLSVDTTAKYYTYKFNGQTTYEDMKRICSASWYPDGVTATDSTKTLKVTDLILNEITTLNFYNSDMSNADFNVICSQELPQLTYIRAGKNKISNINALATFKETLEAIALSNNNISNVRNIIYFIKSNICGFIK